MTHGKPSGLKKVWFTQPLDTEGVVETNDFGRAPFILLVEYLPPYHGKYAIKARVQPRDEEMAKLIERHKFEEIEIFVDTAAEANDEKRSELKGQLKAGLDEGGLQYVWSWRLTVNLARQVSALFESIRVVRVSWGSLLKGTEIKGGFEELRRVVKELTMAVDKLGAQIDSAKAFDTNEVRVYAPGSKIKADKTKPNTPPSKWRR